MATQKRFFEESISYHILSRAVEERRIFLREEDCYRFIFQMYAANIGKPSFNLHRQDVIKAAKTLLMGEEIPSKLIIVEHPLLVHFLSFVLPLTHFHFDLVPAVKNGIPIYMQKLKGGFAKYFNLKYDRQETLFGSRYKSIPIRTNFQSDAIIRYINIINPLDIYQPGWRERGLKNWKEPFKFLNNYQFSSFPDIFGKRKSKILAPSEVLEKYLGKEIKRNQREYLKFVKDFLKGKMEKISPLFLE